MCVDDFYAKMYSYFQDGKVKDASFDCCPLVHKEGMPMNTMEVLTLLLVVFAALAYIDEHKKK